jgi:HTH-type transcriptional regulator, quorum sensing regulator NprR
MDFTNTCQIYIVSKGDYINMDIIEIFGKKYEQDFLAGWIKYNRLQNNYSQEALAYGVCSISHLSYFENGKRTLRPEIIEALLKKLNIVEIVELGNVRLIRQKFYNMMLQIEALNFEGAKIVYSELLTMNTLIDSSLYNIEYKIYQLLYYAFVEGLSYDELKHDLQALDKIYSSLTKELQYLYMLVSGRLIYKFTDHTEGIKRLKTAHDIKETPWINYLLGFAHCFNTEALKGTYYLEKSLDSYERNGQYVNAVWCHNYLGICHVFLKIYDKAEMHFRAALTAAEYFNMDEFFWHIYTNLSDLYYCVEDYEESIKWSSLCMQTSEDPILPVFNYIEACVKLGRVDEYKLAFDNYLVEMYQASRYYNLLYFSYLSLFHFKEDLFYTEVTEKILPYYENINYMDICRQIKLKLIEHLEDKRKYKEANKLYRGLLG